MSSVLIVDSSRTTQAFVRSLLEQAGVEPLQASALPAALDCLRNHPDVALVLVEDVLLESAERVPFLSRVRQLCGARVIVLTDASTAPVEGADGFVRPAFTPAWLQSQLKGRSAVIDAPEPPRPLVRPPSPEPPVDGRVRVLVVDDSAVVRAVVRQVLEEDSHIEVVGTAPNGLVALDMVRGLEPDLVTLDLEMPVMDGLETLGEIRRSYPALPVVVFTAVADGERGVLALTLGASDLVAKPEGVTDRNEMLRTLRQTLLPRVQNLGAAPRPVPVVAPIPRGPRQRVDLVVVAVSTGGPEALGTLLADFTPDFPVPLLIVQHMPAEFTRLLAGRLSGSLSIPVREAAHGDDLSPGTVWLAAGGRHLEVEGAGGLWRAGLTLAPAENSCRPSADVLFRSAARVAGGHVLGVVMTGMGQDGLRGCEAILQRGGQVLAQDRASSTVWGMPGAVAESGLADAVLPLRDLGLEIRRRVTR